MGVGVGEANNCSENRGKGRLVLRRLVCEYCDLSASASALGDGDCGRKRCSGVDGGQEA